MTRDPYEWRDPFEMDWLENAERKQAVEREWLRLHPPLMFQFSEVGDPQSFAPRYIPMRILDDLTQSEAQPTPTEIIQSAYDRLGAGCAWTDADKIVGRLVRKRPFWRCWLARLGQALRLP